MRNFALRQVAALAVAASLSVLLAATNASATVIYSYTGNNFTDIIDEDPPAGTNYDTSMSITGSFELASPLAPNLPSTDFSALVLSHSFDDGRITMTDADSSMFLALSTDAAGLITEWVVTVSSDSPVLLVGDQWSQIQTANLGLVHDIAFLAECTEVGCLTGAGEDQGANFFDPGTWTVNAIPEPSTATLLTLGLVGIAAGRRRKAARAQ